METSAHADERRRDERATTLLLLPSCKQFYVHRCIIRNFAQPFSFSLSFCCHRTVSYSTRAIAERERESGLERGDWLVEAVGEGEGEGEERSKAKY